ncbi:MAG: hypothetical protein GXP63_04810 [DPANN group archaeon]|nr:hypothetical protein [DPANN group archaeon]
MRRFLKRLTEKLTNGFFEKEQETEEVTVRREDLEKLFDEKAVSLIEQEKARVGRFVGELESIKSSIREDLSLLEHAQLKNKNIPNKHLQLLEGNRPAYIQKMHDFNEKLSLEDSFDALEPFVEKTRRGLEHLSKSTTKSYMILQEFFANESFKVARDIKKVDELVESIEGYLSSSPYASYLKIKGLFGKLRNIDARKRELETALKQRKAGIARLKKERRELEAEIAALKSGDAYQEHLHVVGERAVLDQRKQELKNAISRDFAQLAKAMKKYERIALDPGWLRKYLADPFKALGEDEDLEIVPLFGKMKERLQDRKIDVKNPGKTIDVLTALEQERLARWQRTLSGLRQDMAALEERDAPASKVLVGLKDKERRLPLLEQDIHREQLLLEREQKTLSPEEKEQTYQLIVREMESFLNMNMTLKDKEG